MPNLKPYHTFGLDATCDRLVTVTSDDELSATLADGALRSEPLFVLGGGSNVVFPGHFAGTVLRMATRGIQLESASDTDCYVRAKAGENWNDFVLYCIAQGWYGLENLVAIPGTVGAAPVQNVGAYGLEAKDVIAQVEAVERASGRQRCFTNAECQFGYRSSIFKTALKDQYIITSVLFHLSSQFSPNLSYKALSEAVAQHHPESLTATQMADLITRLRWSKLPRPEELGSAGSFFKNPVVDEAHYLRLRTQYPDLVAYPQPQASDTPGQATVSYKLSAGWLIDHAGWKGRRMGPVGVYEKQALVLVNHGGATAADVQTISDAIVADIYQRYGVTLTPEAIFVHPAYPSH